MFLSQQQPAETNSDLFTDEDRQFIEAKAAEAAIESFAEYYDTFFENTGDDTNLKKTDPELYKTWLSLQAILAVAATQNSTPIPQLVY